MQRIGGENWKTVYMGKDNERRKKIQRSDFALNITFQCGSDFENHVSVLFTLISTQDEGKLKMKFKPKERNYYI